MTRKTKHGFTLVELMLVITIIAIITALGLTVYNGAEEDALINRTKSQIERISNVINTKLEEFVYRIPPIRLDPATYSLEEIRLINLAAKEELLRVEFPTRSNDLLNDTDGADAISTPFSSPPAPAQYLFPLNALDNPTSYDWANFPEPQMVVRYRAKMGMPTNGEDFGSDWSPTHDGAELLYAILSLMTLETGDSALSILRANQFADTDDDGYPEVIDAFGDPLDVNLINADFTNDKGQIINEMGIVDNDFDPHIDPRFDPADMNDAFKYPSQVHKYRMVISSRNLRGKLD